jgi:AbrB family looped-hinge helix DNA binding protein
MKKEKDTLRYGLATLGEKGQVVIPADMRSTMGFKKGDKLLVFTTGHNMVSLGKLSEIEEFTAHLSQKISHIQKAIRTEKHI